MTSYYFRLQISHKTFSFIYESEGDESFFQLHCNKNFDLAIMNNSVYDFFKPQFYYQEVSWLVKLVGS